MYTHIYLYIYRYACSRYLYSDLNDLDIEKLSKAENEIQTAKLKTLKSVSKRILYENAENIRNFMHFSSPELWRLSYNHQTSRHFILNYFFVCVLYLSVLTCVGVCSDGEAAKFLARNPFGAFISVYRNTYVLLNNSWGEHSWKKLSTSWSDKLVAAKVIKKSTFLNIYICFVVVNIRFLCYII